MMIVILVHFFIDIFAVFRYSNLDFPILLLIFCEWLRNYFFQVIDYGWIVIDPFLEDFLF